MARRELIQYIDDLDGTTLDSEDVKVTRFSLNGHHYVMDLSSENADRFAELLRPYIDKASVDNEATQPGRSRRKAGNTNASQMRERNRAIRQWAKESGYDVADRGALSKDIITAYESAHSA